MAKKKMKIVISETVREKLEVAFEELIARGAENFEMSDVLTRLIEVPEAHQVLDDFVNEKTPESYKINQLLNTPAERDKVLELLKDKSFGLSGNAPMSEADH